MSEAIPEDMEGGVQPEHAMLEHRLAFEKLISGISTHFVNVAPGELDAEIEKALERVATFIGAERAYLYTFENAETASLTHEWSADPSAHKLETRTFPIAHFPWSIDRLTRNEFLRVRTAELPPEAVAERTMYERAGNRSIIRHRRYGFRGHIGNWRDRRDWRRHRGKDDHERH